MAICDVCGNDYDKAFRVTQAGKTMTFDSFECAIQAMAPQCAHCHCHVIGHAVEAGAVIYCCAHCAWHGGARRVAEIGSTTQSVSDGANDDAHDPVCLRNLRAQESAKTLIRLRR